MSEAPVETLGVMTLEAFIERYDTDGPFEIISKNDNYTDVTDKVARYLNDGVKIVWVVDPKLRKIVVHTAGGIPRTLTEKDTLDGGDVLPDLRIAVAEIFGS